jgi:D-aminopeptidase
MYFEMQEMLHRTKLQSCFDVQYTQKSTVMKIRIVLLSVFITVFSMKSFSQGERLRDYGVSVGVLSPGYQNAITDVEGVRVGHVTLNEGDDIRTGVTAILPHTGNIFQQKVPAAIHVGNGFGKLAGVTQVRELGNIETPIVLTNTLSVPKAANGLLDYTLSLPGNENVRSVNPVVGETNDGWLNNIRGRHVDEKHVIEAINKADGGRVEEGNVGAGTGTICFGFKGGIGTSSRVLPEKTGGYTVGVLVQSNFGGVLQINGAPVGRELGKYYMSDALNDDPDGSCMMVVATDAPLNARNLERLAKRAMLGLGKTGGISSNGSGDYVIAFSTADRVRIPYRSEARLTKSKVLRNSAMSPLFMATIEATQEAILNSLFVARTMEGRDGHMVEQLPVEEVLDILEKYNMLHTKSGER